VDLKRLYRTLRLVRRVDEETARVYPSDAIKSPIHLSIGQEAAAVGVCDVLDRGDVVATSYRSHAAYLAKGGDLRAMFAEMFGKAAGCAGGRGGSMHLIAPEVNVMGASAVVATQIPHAVGAALARRTLGTRDVAVVFFGDGATEEGVFHESLNFAALKRLPVLFVCENNGLAIHAPLSERWATRRLAERVATYGIPTRVIADGDVTAVRAAAAELVAPMRDGGGPAFLEVHVCRMREHVGPNEDLDADYRDPTEAVAWRERDPVARVGAMIDATERAAIDAEVEAEIADALAFAETAPYPLAEELRRHVFAE